MVHIKMRNLVNHLVSTVYTSDVTSISYVTGLPRARNNGRSTDNVRPECGVVRSNSYPAGHFDRSLSVKEQTSLHLN